MTQKLSQKQHWERAVQSKLVAEGLTLDSDWPEIEACLSKVVAAPKCIQLAREMVIKRRGISNDLPVQTDFFWLLVT